ncbi:MAG: carbon-nitrogen hydrolase family protein [Candidatus Thermoplasmatota archaeon]
MKLCICQLSPELGNKEENLKKMIKAMNEKKAELYIFPELFLTGYSCNQKIFSLSEKLPSNATLEIERYSKKKKCSIIFGLPEKDMKGIIYNTAVFVSQDCLQKYRKWYLPQFGPFDEKRYFKEGDELNLISTKYGKIGILICYDIFFPELAKIYALNGADILVCISAAPSYSRRPFEKIIPARAIENALFIAYANLVGNVENLEFFGGSCIVGPKGELKAKAQYYKEELLECDININEIDIARRNRPTIRDTRYEAFEIMRMMMKKL